MTDPEWAGAEISENPIVWFQIGDFVRVEKDGNLTICINKQPVTMHPREWHRLTSGTPEQRPDEAKPVEIA
jgi:hypothetical protein